MKPSLRGHLLPESEVDFGLLMQSEAGPKFLSCYDCQKPFSKETVFTPAGWRETQLSGMCEECFDNLFPDE